MIKFIILIKLVLETIYIINKDSIYLSLFWVVFGAFIFGTLMFYVDTYLNEESVRK